MVESLLLVKNGETPLPKSQLAPESLRAFNVCVAGGTKSM